MKTHYDKVLFVLALILLGVGAAIFFKGGGLPSAADSAVLAKNPTGEAYAAVIAPPLAAANYDWPDSIEQAPGFLYAIFTPPKIWWDPVNREWIAEPPVPLPPFGLTFNGLKTVLYRLQLKTVAGDLTRPRLTFSDEEGKDSLARSVSGFPGETKTENGFIIGEFKTERKLDPRGLLVTVQTVSVQDLRLNKTVVLELNKAVVIPGTEYLSFTTSNPYSSQPWEVRAVGETLSVGDPAPAKFTVREINLSPANPSATIDKQMAPPSREPLTRARFTTGVPTGNAERLGR